MIADALVGQSLLVLFERLLKVPKFPHVDLFGSLNDYPLPCNVIDLENVFQAAPELPLLGPQVCEKLVTYLGPFDFEAFILVDCNLAESGGKIGVVEYEVGCGELEEHVVVLVVFQGEPVAHQQ